VSERQIAVVLPLELAGARVKVDDVGGGKTAVAASNGAHAVAPFRLTIGSDCSDAFTYVTVDADGCKPYRKDGVFLHAGAVQVRIGVAGDPSRHSDTFLPALEREYVAGSFIHPRHGLVRRGPGRSVLDDDGEYYPLNTNIFFNAIYWLDADYEKLRRGLRWARSHGVDDVRAFLTLHFGNVSVDPRRPDWESLVTRFFDLVYDEFEMRVTPSVVGPDYWLRTMADYETYAHRAARLIHDRATKIRGVEICNEASVTGLPKDILRRVTEIIVAESGVALIGATSDVPGEPDDRSKPMQVLQTRAWGCTQAIAQMGRTGADLGWYQVAQPPADWRRYPDPYDHNEPFGPGASSAGSYEPIHLATNRAISIMFGGAAWTLHNGGGIDGLAHAADANHPAVPANPDETQNIDAIMEAVRGVDRWLPPQATDGRYQDMRLQGAMVGCDAWSRGAPQGAYRAWFQLHEDGSWWAVVAGIRGSVTLRPTRSGTLDAFDILEGPVNAATFEPGQSVRLTPTTHDHNELGTLILRGQFTDDAPAPPNAVPWGRAEWGVWFAEVKQRHGLSTLTQAACEIFDAELWLLAGEGEKDSFQQYRGRGYCPTGDPANLYGKYFDMGSFGGPLIYVPRF
jgi:hypothetical protein